MEQLLFPLNVTATFISYLYPATTCIFAVTTFMVVVPSGYVWDTPYLAALLTVVLFAGTVLYPPDKRSYNISWARGGDLGQDAVKPNVTVYSSLGRKSSTYLGLDTSCPMRPIQGAPSRKQAWEGNSWLFGLCCWLGFDCDVSQRIERKGKQRKAIERIEDWSREVKSWIFCGQKNWKFVKFAAHIPTVINRIFRTSEIRKNEKIEIFGR